MNSIDQHAHRKKTPLIHRYFASPLSGEEIEAKSMEIIDREAPSHSFDPDQWQVIRRMVHATGDFSLMNAVRFSPDAIAIGIEALHRGSPIYVDSRMISSGLSLQRLQSICPAYSHNSIICYISDDEVKQQAHHTDLPRAIYAIRKARPLLDGAIAVFGNSPIALLELNRMILEEAIRPALVIAMPVGFVHVVESKEELISLDVPYIALLGRRGGSPLAVSVIHALCLIAAEHKSKTNPTKKKKVEVEKEAIILLGHGSRVPGASSDMEQVANRLKEKYGYPWVEVCFVSRLGPHFPEVFKKCVNQRAQKVLVIPYFLHEGLHLLLDIPEMMQKEAEKFPHVKLILGKNIGFDEGLVDIVEQRIRESEDLCDVRNLTLPKREQYPIPLGQFEFVPMLPEEASKYRR